MGTADAVFASSRDALAMRAVEKCMTGDELGKVNREGAVLKDKRREAGARPLCILRTTCFCCTAPNHDLSAEYRLGTSKIVQLACKLATVLSVSASEFFGISRS